MPEIESPDHIHTFTAPDGTRVDFNASTYATGLLNAQGGAIDSFAKIAELEVGASHAFGMLGLGAGAIVSALENNAQGLSIADNALKTTLDGATGFTAVTVSTSLGALIGTLAAGPPGGYVGGTIGAVGGGFVGSYLTEKVFPYLKQAIINSNFYATQGAQDWANNLPIILDALTPGAPSIKLYNDGTIDIPALSITFGSDGSVVSPDGVILPAASLTGDQNSFNYMFKPADGSPSISFSAQGSVDSSGAASLNVQYGDANGVIAASGPLDITPTANSLVQQNFTPDGTSGFITIENPDASVGWANVAYTLNGTQVVGQDETDNAGNTFTFGFDGEGKADVEVIKQFGTDYTTYYNFDTLNQQPWTTLANLYQGGVPVASDIFNRDGSVESDTYDNAGNTIVQTIYTPNEVLENVYDQTGTQAFSNYSVQYDLNAQSTTLTQFERNGDVYVDYINTATGNVVQDTHYRANGGMVTYLSNDPTGSASYISLAANYTAKGQEIDSVLYNRDGSVFTTKYDLNNHQSKEIDTFRPNSIAQFFKDTDNTLPWQSLSNYFDGQGNFQSETIIYNNGPVVSFSNGTIAAPSMPGPVGAPGSMTGGSPGTKPTINPGIYTQPPVAPPTYTPGNPSPSTTPPNVKAPGDPTIYPGGSPGTPAPQLPNPLYGGGGYGGGNGPVVGGGGGAPPPPPFYTPPSGGGGGGDPGAPSAGYIPGPAQQVPTLFAVTGVDPLIVNLQGPVTTTSANLNGVTVDFTGTGVPQSIGWITSGEGFLVSDPSYQPITSARQLLGTADTLVAFDTNNDGVINGLDAGFSKLQIFVPNANGGTVSSLSDFGIDSINLLATPEDVFDNGNYIRNFSTIVGTNGSIGQIAEVTLIAKAIPTPSPSPLFLTNHPPVPVSFTQNG